MSIHHSQAEYKPKFQELLLPSQEKGLFFYLWSLSHKLSWCSFFWPFNASPPFKHKDSPVASAEPHKCLGILPVAWCTYGVPLTLPLSMFVSSLYQEWGLAAEITGQGWRNRMADSPFWGSREVVGRGTHMRRGSEPDECIIVPLDIT